MTSPGGPLYSARYGRTPKHIVGIAFGFVLSAVILLIPAPTWLKVLVVVFVGGAAVMLAVVAASRTPALQVDAAGVTIRPFTVPVSVILFFPWEEVVQIVLIRARRAPQFVYILLREGAQLTSQNRSTRPLARKALAFDGRPAGNTRSYLDPPRIGIAVNGWTLHPARLADAVARFAPAVRVVDLATGSVVDHAQQPHSDGA